MKKPSRTTIRNKLDKAFSDLVRSRGRCERCGRSSGVQLQTSHIFSRRHLAVRWDADNAQCLCAGCHRWVHDNPLSAARWWESLYGKEKLTELERKAQSIRKWTNQELLDLLTKLTHPQQEG